MDKLVRRTSSMRLGVTSNDSGRRMTATKCSHDGCDNIHRRSTGLCPQHEASWKKLAEQDDEEETLLPGGCEPTFLDISGYGIVRYTPKRRHAVFLVNMRCAASGASWTVYRRYEEFDALANGLAARGFTAPELRPQHGESFDCVELSQEQWELAEWLRATLGVVDGERPLFASNIMRKFLTFAANRPPHMERVIAQAATAPSERTGSTRGVNMSDFDTLKVLGRGSFGQVMLVRKKDTGKLYAMKVLVKKNVVKRKQVEHTRTERRVLGYTHHPFIVALHFAFQTENKLYFVLDYCAGGELFFHLSRLKRLTEDQARIVCAELVLALGHLHNESVVYRDLKPENILLGSDGHVKLADFGLAKEGVADRTGRTNSVCGTPEYLAPEVLDKLGHGTTVDWWCLGMVLYEMLTGLPPWYTQDRRTLFARIRGAKLTFPPYVSDQARDLISAFLDRAPESRLGAEGVEEVKGHAFFNGLNWDDLYHKRIEAPIHPSQERDNFETEFTSMPLPSEDLTVRDERASSTFNNFSYARTRVHNDSIAEGGEGGDE